MKHLKPSNTALQPSWISPKLSTESGTLGSYTTYDNLSNSIITSFSVPIYITDTSKSRLKIHTQTSSPSTREYLKVVPLALYFTSSTLLTYKPPQTLPYPPLRMILLSWPLTLIRLLPPRNYKPASLLFSIGLPNGN
jgi:hypothetical protein